MELDRAIALYMNDCRARQLRPKTMLSYEQALKLFALWLVDTFGMTAIGKIAADHIRQYNLKPYLAVVAPLFHSTMAGLPEAS